MKYLDLQAEVGITKHVGGFAATDELLSLCHVEDARETLNVGCGIGVGVAYIASKFRCRVMGVDISEKMIKWSRLRAKEEKVEDKVEFRVADVLALPFEDDRFDAVHRKPLERIFQIEEVSVCIYEPGQDRVVAQVNLTSTGRNRQVLADGINSLVFDDDILSFEEDPFLAVEHAPRVDDCDACVGWSLRG